MNHSKKIIAETKFLRLVERDRWVYVERANASGVVCVVARTADDAIEQQQPGAVVFFNGDDDDNNGLADVYQTGPISGENDLQAANLSLVVPSGVSLDGYQLQIETIFGGEFIRLWSTADKQTEIPLGTVWTLGSGSPETYFPSTIYVEAVDAGYVQLDLVLFDAAAVEVHRDQVALAAAKVKIVYAGKIDISGKKFTTVVGQVHSLEAVVVPKALKVTKRKWTIPGTIVEDYQVKYTSPGFKMKKVDAKTVKEILPTTGKVVKVKSLKNANIKFAWVDAGANRKVEHSLHVGGKVISASVIIDTLDASFTLDVGGVRKPSVFKMNGFSNQELGYPDVAKKPAFAAKYQVKGTSEKGSFQWVQLVKVDISMKTVTNKSIVAKSTAWELDTRYPYNVGFYAVDTPSEPLLVGNVSKDVKESFRMYLDPPDNTNHDIYSRI
ncbi:MAG: hypothetical protein Tsb009_34940 [Planctomycetaceae bacterium]